MERGSVHPHIGDPSWEPTWHDDQTIMRRLPPSITTHTSASSRVFIQGSRDAGATSELRSVREINQRDAIQRYCGLRRRHSKLWLATAPGRTLWRFDVPACLLMTSDVSRETVRFAKDSEWLPGPNPGNVSGTTNPRPSWPSPRNPGAGNRPGECSNPRKRHQSHVARSPPRPPDRRAIPRSGGRR